MGAVRTNPGETAAIRTNLPARLAAGPPLLLDGATGSELERRGVRCSLPLWSTHALLEAPDTLESIHRDYVEAGAGAITANTFRTQRRTLEHAGAAARAAELTERAVALARRACGGRDVLVLGSAPPLEDCYRPDLAPDPGALAAEHAEHARNLADAGADAILVETHNNIAEAVAATRAARATGLPVITSFVCGRAGHLLSGEPLEAALAALALLDPAAVAVNCVSPATAARCIPVLVATGLPLGLYANVLPDGDATPALSAREYALHALGWIQAGARFVGGCCGTTPTHIRCIATHVGA